MNGNGWNTKEDLLEDLMRHGFKAKDIDEDFIVRGGMPPPPPRHLTDEDDEIQLRYGSLADRGDHDDTVGPDLAGITQMLRMVNEINYNSENEIENGDQLIPKKTLTISKLDPSVKEFVPKDKKPEVVKNSHNVNGINALKKEIMKASEDKIEEKTQNNIENTQNAGQKNVDDEKLRMADLLKSKIIKTSKSNTSQHKRERNAAIAALIKLNSTPPDSITPKIQSGSNSPKKAPISESPTAESNPPKPLLLVDPQYYLSTCTNQVNNETPIEETTTLEPKKIKPECVEGPTSCFTKVYREHPTCDRSVAEPTFRTSIEPKRFEPVIDPQMKESIDKVNNWLSPKKPKPKAICLEEITFKKKDNPSTSSSPSTVPKVEAAAIKSFVPSSYANELMKTYKERSKIQQTLQGDIWTNLDRQLKEKDEEIRKRRELELSTIENQNEPKPSTSK